MNRLFLLVSVLSYPFLADGQNKFSFVTNSGIEVKDTVALDRACENGACTPIEDLIFITLDIDGNKAIINCKSNPQYDFELDTSPLVKVDERVTSCFIVHHDEIETLTIYFEHKMIILTKKNGHRILFMNIRDIEEGSFWNIVMLGVTMTLKSEGQIFVEKFDDQDLESNDKKKQTTSIAYLIDIDPLARTIKVENTDSKEVVISVTYKFFEESSFENLNGFVFAEFDNPALFKITFIPDQAFILNYKNNDRLILYNLSLF